MNTVNVYIEPLFIGALVLAILAILFFPEIMEFAADDRRLRLPGDLALSTLTLGAAYLTGTAADRLIDACLSELERHNRARFALGLRERADDRRPRHADPFPEGWYRVSVMIHEQKAAEWLDALRTRLRLTRALAFTFPGLTYASAMMLLRTRCAGSCSIASPDMIWVATGVLAGCYMGILILRSCLRYADPMRRVPREDWERKFEAFKKRLVNAGACVGRWFPPRTDQSLCLRLYAHARKRATSSKAGSTGLVGDVLLSPFVIMAAVIHAIPLGLAIAMENWGVATAIIAGGAVSAFALWGWWKTNETFMIYVHLCGQVLKDRKAE